MSRHTELIDAVNDAKTQYEHTYADAFLRGWRAGQEEAGRRWDFVEADEHTMKRFGAERPVCCGVLLDVKPPRFADTFCSQCGMSLGPGDAGVSHCSDHGSPT